MVHKYMLHNIAALFDNKWKYIGIAEHQSCHKYKWNTYLFHRHCMNRERKKLMVPVIYIYAYTVEEKYNRHIKNNNKKRGIML